MERTVMKNERKKRIIEALRAAATSLETTQDGNESTEFLLREIMRIGLIVTGLEVTWKNVTPNPCLEVLVLKRTYEKTIEK